MSAARSQAARKAMLAKIHIAKVQLGLSREDYLAVLAPFGVESSSRLDLRGLDRLLRRFEQLGFEAAPIKARKSDKGAPRQAEVAGGGYMATIEATLARIGELEGGHVPWSYATATLKRMCGCERLEWATPDQLRGVVAALAIRVRKLEKRAMQAAMAEVTG